MAHPQTPPAFSEARAAAEDLASKLSPPCPVCGAPGFRIIERVAGLQYTAPGRCGCCNP